PAPSLEVSSRLRRSNPQTPTAKGWLVRECPGRLKSGLRSAAKAFAGRAELPRLRVRCPALLQTFVFSLGELLFNNFGELQTPLPILGLSESRPLRGGAHELPAQPTAAFHPARRL